MQDIIQFEGEIVRHIRTEVVKETTLADYLPQLEHRPPVTIGLLPKTAIFIHWDESDPKKKKVQLFAEVSAGMKTCDYNGKKYALSMPWTYFLFDFETSGDPMQGANWTQKNVRVYWSREAITQLDQEMATALIPNVDTHGQICWGSTGVDTGLSLGMRVDRIVEEFYRTQFTHSNGAGSPYQTETAADDWSKWVKESAVDPAAFLKFPEWDKKKKGNPMKFFKLRDILGTLGDRSRPIEVDGRIPEMVSPMTFGRADEWIAGLYPAERSRLLDSLINLQKTNPKAFEGALVPAP